MTKQMKKDYQRGKAWMKKNLPGLKVAAPQTKAVASKPKPAATWIVVIRCNLDDVIIGAYMKWAEAFLRMKDALLGPEEDLKRHPSPADRWDNSGLIGVAIYRARGDNVENWQQKNFGEEKQAA